MILLYGNYEVSPVKLHIKINSRINSHPYKTPFGVENLTFYGIIFCIVITMVYFDMKMNDSKLTLSNNLIFRAPRLSLNATMADSWLILKEAIADSSPEFYNLIKQVEVASELEALQLNIQYTVWKYFNRAKFRSTPFGLFAGFGTASFGSKDCQGSIVLDHFHPHTFTEWDINESKGPVNLENHTIIISNNTFYRLGADLRYIRREVADFELCQIPFDKTLYAILTYCSNKQRYQDIIGTFLPLFDDGQELEETIQHLVRIQLLLPEYAANVIGQDYFKRVNFDAASEKSQYILSEIITSNRCISRKHFEHLPRAVTILNNIFPLKENKNLSRFINDFSKKFELREVPIMIALDPEVGVSYGDLENTEGGKDLIESLKKQSNHNENINPDPFKKEFLTNLTFSKPSIDLETVQGINSVPNLLPNTFTTLLSDAGGMFCIEALGGATATAMAGRFTLASQDIYTACQDIKEKEESANPGVLFFDIGYQSEGHIDNINRRRSIYDHQVSFLDYDTSKEPLCLNDILVSVSANEVILRSRTLNKRLIPKMSSAYNYSRSDLSVFRFLCDLQHQGLRNNLKPDLMEIFPGLDFYPRIQYKNLIISRAKWKFSYGTGSSTNLTNETLLTFIFRERKIPKFFRAGSGDQTLFFERDSPIDRLMFLHLLRKSKELYIEEAFKPKNSMLLDSKNNHYNCEIMITLQHGHQCYRPVSFRSFQQDMAAVQRVIPPGGKWLYFEIYCHPQRANEILSSFIDPFLTQFHGKIHEWFFIRYNHPDDHLRLRLHLVRSNDAQQITGSLSSKLANYIESGIIPDFSIKTYKRELERYAMVSMSAIERHFYIDSQFAIAVIFLELPNNLLYQLIISTILYLRDSDLFEYDRFDGQLNKISRSLSKEHGLGLKQHKEINENYKQHIQFGSSISLPPLQLQRMGLFRNSLIQVLKLHTIEEGLSLFRDLMHMHINRLFSTDQRTHEMLIYDYTLKRLMQPSATAVRRA